jgi:hypothetical protein
MSTVKAPFSDEQVKHIQAIQDHLGLLTCLRNNCDNDILKATNQGLICSCGKYKQDWVPEGFHDSTLLSIQKEFEATFKFKQK